MTYQNFIQEVTREIRRRLPAQAQVETKQILKNNGLCLDGLIITEDSINVSPTIYLNYYYEQYQDGMTTAEISRRILTCYRQHRLEDSVDLSFFTDFSKVQPNIIYRLIHQKQNADLLRDVPHLPYLDLAIVFCYYLATPPGCDGTATILIHNSHLPYWNVTPDVLMRHAAVNTPRLFPGQLTDIREVIAELLPGKQIPRPVPGDDGLCPMYLLTNQNRLHGACCILYESLLQSYADRFRSDLIILPSSIHEVLLVPADSRAAMADFADIVPEINSSCVSPEEVLSLSLIHI